MSALTSTERSSARQENQHIQRPDLSLLLSTIAKVPEMISSLAHRGQLNARELKKAAIRTAQFEGVYRNGLENRFSTSGSKESFDALKSQFENGLSASQWDDLQQRIEMVWHEFTSGYVDEIGKSDTAFLIHQRTTDEHIRLKQGYGDAAAFGPQLATLIENEPDSELLATHMVNTLPPFRAAVTTYKDTQGHTVRGSVICIPIDINALTKPDVSRADLEDMYARVLIGADFMYDKIGVRQAGLGAVLPRISHYGESMRMMTKKRGGKETLQTTTGHGMTVALMIESMYRTALKYDTAIDGSTMAVVGCGVIGKAFTNVLYSLNSRPHPAEILLFDTNSSQSRTLQEQLLQTKYGKDTKITIVDSAGQPFDKVVQELAGRVDIMIGAATSPFQVDLEQAAVNRASDLIVVDDSQPTLARQVQEKGGKVHLVWPTAHIKTKNYRRDGVAVLNGKIVTIPGSFNYGPQGLVEEIIDGEAYQTVWGCELEAYLLGKYGLMEEMAVQGGVTPEIAKQMLELLEKDPDVSIHPAMLQSYGQVI